MRPTRAKGLLVLFGVFVAGTIIVVSSFAYWFALDARAFLTDVEVPILGRTERWNATEHGRVERVPRILHQTYKTTDLPSLWQETSKGCKAMMPDYEYMFWTDESSRTFIRENYPWFLDTFDGYVYPIQRADAIRYFILYHYGGVYLDLDVRCMRPLDHLLPYQVVLPETRPIGISNDIILAEKGHPFFAQAIHNLVTFDHSWILNYPTVMFSTGPMFLSAQYNLYSTSHPPGSDDALRVLPISMYGKYSNAPDAFFEHLFGSSWHADDAPIVSILHHHGMEILYSLIALLVIGVLWTLYKNQRESSHRGTRWIGAMEVVLPQWTNHSGNRWQLDLGWLALPSSAPSGPPSPSNSDDDLSSSHMQRSFRDSSESSAHHLLRWAREQVTSVVSPQNASRPNTTRRRSSSRRGVMFFLPAVFAHPPTPQDMELSLSGSRPPSYHDASWGAEKSRNDPGHGDGYAAAGSTSRAGRDSASDPNERPSQSSTSPLAYLHD